jgi:hypothetical protein
MSTIGHVDARRAARCTAAGFACILHVGWATVDAPVANPLGGGDSVALEPAPPPAQPLRRRPIFICQQGGVPVFADRPCGSTAVARNLVIDSPRPGGVATTTPPAPRAVTRPRVLPGPPDAAAAPQTETRCVTLQRQLDELNDRMRAGYSAREAARLWQRWRDTKERLRATRC